MTTCCGARLRGQDPGHPWKQHRDLFTFQSRDDRKFPSLPHDTTPPSLDVPAWRGSPTWPCRAVLCLLSWKRWPSHSFNPAHHCRTYDFLRQPLTDCPRGSGGCQGGNTSMFGQFLPTSPRLPSRAHGGLPAPLDLLLTLQRGRHPDLPLHWLPISQRRWPCTRRPLIISGETRTDGPSTAALGGLYMGRPMSQS